MNNHQKILLGLVLVTSCYLLVTISRYWYADHLYSQGKQEQSLGRYEECINNLQRAIKLSPTESVYHNEMARVFTNITSELMDKDYGTEAAKFAPYALSESDIAYKLSPRNMNIRETRVNTYLEISQLNPKYLESAVDLIQETMIISPTDPKLHLALGKAYANMGKFEKAKEAFKKALELKPDYDQALRDLEILENIEKKK